MSSEAYLVDGKATEGWDSTIVRASTRNLPWWDMVCEFVDNALANRRIDRKCMVAVMFERKGKRRSLTVRDNGVGCDNPELFLRPGLTAGNLSDYGNSTFGTGLFVIECHLGGRMEIITDPGDGAIRHITREIAHSQTGECTEWPAEEKRTLFGIDLNGGTLIRFQRYTKRGPTKEGVERIVRTLTRCYSDAIREGVLAIEVIYNGAKVPVLADSEPALLETFKTSLTIDSHVFHVKWGVTCKVNTDGGCRLLYGGKLFDTTIEPCGDYNVGRFYAEIRVPHSAGEGSMDLLKRSIERECMDELYDRCIELFEPQLIQAHKLAEDDEDDKLNDEIARLLSARADKLMQPEPGGNEDLRAEHRRDQDGNGVQPKHTGRKRYGRRQRRRAKEKGKAPDELDVKFLHLGTDESLARYRRNGSQLQYNRSHDIVESWRKGRDSIHLAQLAAAYIAFALHDADPQKRLAWEPEGKFDDIYRDLLSRLVEAVTA